MLCCHTVTSSEELLLSISNGHDIAPLNCMWLSLKGKAVPSPQRTKEAADPVDKHMVGKHRKRPEKTTSCIQEQLLQGRYKPIS